MAMSFVVDRIFIKAVDGGDIEGWQFLKIQVLLHITFARV